MLQRYVVGTSLFCKILNNCTVGAFLIGKNYNDLWRNKYPVSSLVVTPREVRTGSRKAAFPAFTVTELHVL